MIAIRTTVNNWIYMFAAMATLKVFVQGYHALWLFLIMHLSIICVLALLGKFPTVSSFVRSYKAGIILSILVPRLLHRRRSLLRRRICSGQERLILERML